ncbi:MAG: chemotaxis protein CheD [Cellvibrionaceae bacterium]|jgi:chemotaxis protein CheD
MQHANKRKEFLNPGEFLFAESGTHIHTLLGSCIAITLWHPYLHIGGMCHYVLPSRPYGEPNSSGKPNGRYGDEAMQLFELAAELHRTELSHYQAKIFGGTDLVSESDGKNKIDVGKKNTAKAMELLNLRQVPIIMAHVGESGSRRIVLDVDSGDVWVKHTAGDGHMIASTSGIN